MSAVGSTGSIPKAPGQRRRRNATAPTFVVLPPQGPAVIPRAPRGLCAEARAWWRVVMRSPMAAPYLSSDIATLRRLARMIDSDCRGRATAADRAEIRQVEDRFGLSPLSRRRLGWVIQATPPLEAVPSQPAESVRARLRSVTGQEGA